MATSMAAFREPQAGRFQRRSAYLGHSAFPDVEGECGGTPNPLKKGWMAGDYGDDGGITVPL
jgi:hypothetical protein